MSIVSTVKMESTMSIKVYALYYTVLSGLKDYLDIFRWPQQDLFVVWWYILRLLAVSFLHSPKPTANLLSASALRSGVVQNVFALYYSSLFFLLTFVRVSQKTWAGGGGTLSRGRHLVTEFAMPPTLQQPCHLNATYTATLCLAAIYYTSVQANTKLIFCNVCTTRQYCIVLFYIVLYCMQYKAVAYEG